jgi:hypothetical protein
MQEEAFQTGFALFGFLETCESSDGFVGDFVVCDDHKIQMRQVWGTFNEGNNSLVCNICF